MKVCSYPGTGRLSVALDARSDTETREITRGPTLDSDARDGVVGFEIKYASRRSDLSPFETETLAREPTKAG